MSRIAYVNGRYLPHGDAAVHIEDRGYQFADGVYEVIAVKEGGLVDEELHMVRLERSLSELRIAPPMARRSLALVMREVIRRNRVRNGIVYLQATRGVARRDHPFPADASTSLVITSRSAKPLNRKAQEEGVKVISIPDIRWARCDIKSVSLLPNVLGKQQARESGAYEAWQIDRDGMVTEGTSTNAWIVTKDGELVTRQTGNEILNGCTRLALLDLARAARLTLAERPFSLAEAKAAREAFLSSTTSIVLPVVQIDDAVIGDGKPGPLGRQLLALYSAHAEREVA
ncbi:MAG: D-amino-acid transaminase [Alphaproteobacteria bacterium]|nr:D-amino-acid transaminase [Alphaproteobacteria bacterium]